MKQVPISATVAICVVSFAVSFMLAANLGRANRADRLVLIISLDNREKVARSQGFILNPGESVRIKAAEGKYLFIPQKSQEGR